jgi:hypothetical protein
MLNTHNPISERGQLLGTWNLEVSLELDFGLPSEASEQRTELISFPKNSRFRVCNGRKSPNITSS